MLECRQLTCVRDDRVLFNEISFTLAPGDILQIEGANGVGKTSLFRLLVGLSSAYAGEVCWQQQNILDDRSSYYRDLLYLGHKPAIKAELSALENLRFFSHLNQLSKQLDLWAILEQVGLLGFEDIPAAQLSAGQQRRIALARLWLSESPLWILDEPFTAIDKQGVKAIEELLLAHAKAGGMVIITTHQDLSLDPQQYQRLLLQKPSFEDEYV